MDVDTDRQLIARYLAGDASSLEILFARYLRATYGFVYHYVGNAHDAEDITQEAFVRAWRNLRKFDRRKNFKTWMFSIAKNAAIDVLKKKKPAAFSDFDTDEGDNVIAETFADVAPLPDALLERKDIAGVLASAMGQLSPNYRAVLSLRYTDRMNFREIGEVLGAPLHTVKSRHRRALLALKKSLTAENQANSLAPYRAEHLACEGDI